MRKKIAAGNWKMNTTLQEGMQLASEVVNMASDEVKSEVQVILIPPFPHLTSINKLVESKNGIYVGAQNCHQEASGAFTGEVSAEILASSGIDFVVIGHSERREYFSESGDLLAAKTNAVLKNRMTPIFCCGEKLEVREQNGHFDLVGTQIKEGLFHLTAAELSKVVIAYEPVWAIGTGVTASTDQAQEMHAHIRQVLAENYDQDLADGISILYGGSVKPDNSRELFACPDVDGGLVGGASLKSRDFVDIAKSFQ